MASFLSLRLTLDKESKIARRVLRLQSHLHVCPRLRKLCLKLFQNYLAVYLPHLARIEHAHSILASLWSLVSPHLQLVLPASTFYRLMTQIESEPAMLREPV